MNTILFDLDGTLLPINQEDFNDTYFKALASRMRQAGFDPASVTEGVLAGIKAMYENEGILTNEDMFMKVFSKYVGEENLKQISKEFVKFYKKDFDVTKFNTFPTEFASKCVAVLKEKGYNLVIATNPLWPQVAIEKRIEWAGLNVDDFMLVTSYENTCFCKPNINYYKRILWTIDKLPEDCLMVGNDATEDLAAAKLGIDIFMVSNCLINNSRFELSDYKMGTLEMFYDYSMSLPSLL